MHQQIEISTLFERLKDAHSTGYLWKSDYAKPEMSDFTEVLASVSDGSNPFIIDKDDFRLGKERSERLPEFQLE